MRENAGVIRQSSEFMTEVRTTNTMAVLAPTSRFCTYFSMACGAAFQSLHLHDNRNLGNALCQGHFI